MSEHRALSVEQIRELLPHRYPFLLVDRVLELEKNKRGVALKNVSVNEPFFNGHFPEFRVMPGVLIVEALAQLSGLVVSEMSEGGKKLGFFAGIDNTRFKKPVTPGDQLRLEVVVDKARRGVVKTTGTATVNGDLACTTEITLMFGAVSSEQ